MKEYKNKRLSCFKAWFLQNSNRNRWLSNLVGICQEFHCLSDKILTGKQRNFSMLEKIKTIKESAILLRPLLHFTSFFNLYKSKFLLSEFYQKAVRSGILKNSTRNFAHKNSQLHLMIPQIFIMCGLGDILISGIVRWHRGWHHSRTIVDKIAIFCFWIPVFSRKVIYYGVLSTCRVQLDLLSMSIRRT